MRTYFQYTLVSVSLTILNLIDATAQALVTVDRDNFIQQSLFTVIYHELGHGLIDHLPPPLSSRTEPSADIVSVWTVDQLYDEDDG